jgi:hypothetical protein
MQRLRELGVHESGRKVRSDSGQTHHYSPTRQTRSDLGKQRDNYTHSSKVLRRHFQQALEGTAIRNHLGEIVGEGATRDANNIFDLFVEKKWRTITRSDGTTYKTRAKQYKPLEQYRWDWLKQEAIENNDPARFCKHYFVKEDEWDVWTYYEWRRAYINIFAGHENTNKDKIPYFDDKGMPIIYHDIIGGIDE